MTTNYADYQKEYRANIAEKLSREEILEILEIQDPEIIKGINRIEWVFSNKLTHLNWEDGEPIVDRPVSVEELSLLVDVPFKYSEELARMGLNEQQQREFFISSDPVLWAKHFLRVSPRVYQIIILRDPSMFKVLRAGRRLGKALDVRTPIATSNGWKTMGTIQVGDQVFDEKGKPCNVTGIEPVRKDRKCYDVIFSDGSKITADADHLWTTHTKQYRKALQRAQNPQSVPTTLTTQQIKETLTVGAKNESNHAVVVAGPIEYEHKTLPIEPYTLGAWLGDGTSREASICVYDKEMLTYIKEDGYELTQWADPNMYTIHGIHGLLKEINVRSNKHIPIEYLTASIDQRKELFKGLMDSDGSVRKSDGYCEFSVMNERLARDFHQLACSLGLRPTFRTGRAMLDGKDCGERYRVGFTPNFEVFKLLRKLEDNRLTDKCKYRYITDVVEVESVHVRCISVDSPSRLFLAGESYIPTHNTWTMAVLLLWYSYITNDGRSLVVTPMRSQADLIFEECIKLSKESKIVYESIERKVKNPNPEIRFSNDSTIRFFTSGMKSAGKSDVTRGQEAHLIILDELDYMGEDDMDALLAMLQKTSENQPEKRLVAASTPSGKKAKLWEWSHNRRFKSFWFPSYVNPYWNIEQEDFFRDFYSDIAYGHEIEADWGENADGVYPRKYVDAAIVDEDDAWEYKLPTTRYYSNDSFTVFGVDWDKYGAGTNIVVLEIFDARHEDRSLAGKVRLLYREETAREEYTLTKSVDRIIYLNSVYNPKHIYIDRGFGETQNELLKKHGVEHPNTGLVKKVKGISFAATIDMPDPHTGQKQKKDIKPFMVDTLRQFLEKGSLMFTPSDAELYMQLISYVVVRTTSSGRPVFEMAGRVQDHCHDALILATLAIKENYDDMMFYRSTNYVSSIKSNILDPLLELVTPDLEPYQKNEIKVTEDFEPVGNHPGKIKRTNLSPRKRRGRDGVSRRMF
jgi:hypothetical protein